MNQQAQQKLLEYILLALGKSQPGVSDSQVLAIGEQLAQEILALVPPPAPPPVP